MFGKVVACLALVGSAACISPSGLDVPGQAQIELPEAELRVLFVGNSLTFVNRLPAIVQTIAEASGHDLAQADISSPNFSLEDHWYAGAPDIISRLAPDVVVMQEGPSSLPENQIYLRDWTQKLDESVRAVGGRSALFMVWPEQARQATAFPAVRTSYSNAAEAVDGIFIPAGEAWMELWSLDAHAALYGPDGFHPSTLGSLVAALTIYRMLFDEPVTDLPARLAPTTPGLPIIVMDSTRAVMVYQAVETAVGKWGRR
ncbi:MAG: hypothetical protein LJF06_16745 [Gemmatimonadetes bacterium]|nr:hypothetical protein [Gemmatimonadota bacterium]